MTVRVCPICDIAECTKHDPRRNPPMTNEIPIPPEAVEAAARAIYLAFTEINIGDGEDRWDRLQPRYRAEYREQAKDALRAALAAWPGGETVYGEAGILQGCIYLPLTKKEARDE